MEKILQNKIINIVKEYKILFPSEYNACREVVKQKRDKNSSTGDMTKQTDLIERPLLEYPENLFFMLQSKLSTDELIQFNTKESARWFGKTFPEFSLVEKI